MTATSGTWRGHPAVTVTVRTKRLLDQQKAREAAQVLTAEIEALTRRLDAMRSDSPLTSLVLAESVPTMWAALPVVDERRAIAELGMVITLDRGKPGVRTFDPASVRVGWNG